MVAPASLRPKSEQIELHAERQKFLKRRWRGEARDGTEFGFDLEARLTHGCVIFQTEQADYVVLQKPELVYEIKIESADFAALVGWKIGNLHFPVQILDGLVRVPPDPAIAQLFQREGWSYEEVTVIFNPLKVMPHAP